LTDPSCLHDAPPHERKLAERSVIEEGETTERQSRLDEVEVDDRVCAPRKRGGPGRCLIDNAIAVEGDE